MPWLTGRVASASVLGLVLASAAGRGDPGGCLTMDQLRRMSACELAELFSRSEMGRPPVGPGRGRVLCKVDTRHPRLKAGMNNAVWKGKTVACDGAVINRWAFGVKAIGVRAEVGPSWIDGRPATVFDYPPDTPLLGNTRDELREVAPGLYLGPLYEKCPCPRLTGWLAVQFDCPCR
jgi:hypothetical protein